MTGYADAYPLYLEKGWPALLPLQRGKKWSPPEKCTGYEGRYPTREQMAAWAAAMPDGNIALRLPPTVVVLDVDHYGDKRGADTIAEAERRWGPLPPTYRNSARPAPSGHRYYRIPEGVKLAGQISFPELGLGHVEILQWFHRYAVTWPSINGEAVDAPRYDWYAPGDVPADDLPGPDHLPELPARWVAELQVKSHTNKSGATTTRTARVRNGAEIPTEGLYDLSDALTEGQMMSDRVERRLGKALIGLHGAGCRHDETRDHVLALLRMGKQGDPGVLAALTVLGRAFINEVTADGSRGEADAHDEFVRFVSNPRAGLLLNEPDTTSADHSFWTRTNILGHILTFARSRGASPYATLGAVLRRTLGCIEPWVVLPATIGGQASLNLFTAVVGASGGGKDIANAAGQDAVLFRGSGLSWLVAALPEAHCAHPGTGEGLARTLGQNRKAHLQLPDIATLVALAERKGQTLVGQLLAGWMGQPIGFTNNNRSTSTALGAHAYRLCLSVGVQPENAAFFLDRQKDGFPQRFLWLPTTDPGHLPYRPEPVNALSVALPDFAGDDGNRVVLTIPDEVADQIWKHSHRAALGDPDVDPLDKHINLTRLKTAAGLDILHGRGEVTNEGWELAGHLIEVSARVRQELREAASTKCRRENTARAHAQADRQKIIEERRTTDHWERVEKAIRSKLGRVGKASRRELLHACDSSIRREFPTVFDVLLEQGILVAEGDDDGVVDYRLSDA
jgi:hypothetical protein